MPQPKLHTANDYHVPLLRLMTELPAGQGSADDVSDLFFERYQDDIPNHHMATLADGKTSRWYKWVAWARYELIQAGLMDSPRRGIWRISSAGRAWLTENPGALRIDNAADEGISADHRGRRREHAAVERQNGVPKIPAGITLEMLESTRKFMTTEQFRLTWGSLYDQLLAQERAKAITPVTDRMLAEKAWKHVQRIQDFLKGRGNDAPKSEEVCDWIHLCYALELYREAAALWQYVSQADVNPWQYERTKKVAAVSRTKVGV